MFDPELDCIPASSFGMPEYASRQWILENSDLGERVMVKTPDYACVPIPEGRAGALFTHALYVVDCYHDEECSCSEDDEVGWGYVRFLDMDGNGVGPGIQHDELRRLEKIVRKMQ